MVQVRVDRTRGLEEERTVGGSGKFWENIADRTYCHEFGVGGGQR